MTDNEEMMSEQITPETEQEAVSDAAEQAARLEQLLGEITGLKLKLALLLGGAAPEKLDEGVKLSEGILAAQGNDPEQAAAEVLREYPHIKLVKRELPKLSAESGGKGDGFAAIRSIFAKK